MRTERENTIIEDVIDPGKKLLGFIAAEGVHYLGCRVASRYSPGSLQKAIVRQTATALQKWVGFGFKN